MSKNSSIRSYRIRVTHPTGVVTYVAERTLLDGSWTTPHANRAKEWKTLRGAQAWLGERPDITNATVEEVRV